MSLSTADGVTSNRACFPVVIICRSELIDRLTWQVLIMRSLPRSIVERMADKRTMPDLDVVVDLLPSESGSVESPSVERVFSFKSDFDD